MAKVVYQQIVAGLVEIKKLEGKLIKEMENNTPEASDTMSNLLGRVGALAKHLKETSEDVTKVGGIAPNTVNLQISGVSLSWDISG